MPIVRAGPSSIRFDNQALDLTFNYLIKIHILFLMLMFFYDDQVRVQSVL